MSAHLVSWIGQADINAASQADSAGEGPLLAGLRLPHIDSASLLYDYPLTKIEPYLKWLKANTDTPFETFHIELPTPMDFTAIYKAVGNVLAELAGGKASKELVYHLSPGTSAMTATWLLMAKTKYPAKLIRSSLEEGVVNVEIPFDISVEYLPELVRERDQKLLELSLGDSPAKAEFDKIIHRSTVMKTVLAQAHQAALYDVPVLIMGESGTGKELLAKAIHAASQRVEETLIAINCGAIPKDLVESELFGHEKGAFTGATSRKAGRFEQANGSTLFLDEVGELPLSAQVKLLRVLQDGEVWPVGATESVKIDVRIIAATNRDLPTAVTEGHFREDLFYRLAVAVLKLPPLRERKGDVGLLLDAFTSEINEELAKSNPKYVSKTISVKVRNIIINAPWPGNVRELRNTLVRTFLMSANATISERDILDSMISLSKGSDGILDRPIEHGFSLDEVMSDVARHYLERAINREQSKTKAAKVLGMNSHQVLDNWLKKYGLKD